MSSKEFKRGPNKIVKPYTFPDMYEDYIKDFDENSPYYVTYKEYVGICSDYYKLMMDEVLERGRRLKLPFRMGDIMVTKKRLKKFDKHHLPIDWAMSRKLGKWVYHMNDHTNNYKYRFRWSKKLCKNTQNIGQYRLVFTRANKRRLAKLIKSGEYDYATHE